MARKTEYGKYILSAGEIGAYTVCPEAWRLVSIVRVKSVHSGDYKRGQDLHKEWAKGIDEASYLKRQIRILLIMLLAALAFVVLF